MYIVQLVTLLGELTTSHVASLDDAPYSYAYEQEEILILIVYNPHDYGHFTPTAHPQ